MALPVANAEPPLAVGYQSTVQLPAGVTLNVCAPAPGHTDTFTGDVGAAGIEFIVPVTAVLAAVVQPLAVAST